MFAHSVSEESIVMNMREEAKKQMIYLRANGFFDTPIFGARMKWLRKNYPIIIDEAEKLIEEYHLTKLTEAFYWIINDITSYPECTLKLDHKCNNRPAFVNYYKGYYEACGNCSKHKPSAAIKAKNTCLERYGVTNAAKHQSIKDKVIQSNIQRFGVAHPIQNPEIMEKMKKTMLAKYGFENPNYVPELRKKSTETLLKSWKDPDKKSSILQKSKDSYLSHYGVEHYSQTDMFKQDIVDAWNNSGRYDKVKQKLLNLADLYDIEFLERLECGKQDYPFRCKKCNYEGKLNTLAFMCGKYYWCPVCHPRSGSSSKGEYDLFTHIDHNFPGMNCIHNSRRILDGKELDLYYPDKKLAIEYCGLMYHATKPTGIDGGGQDEDYHINKYLKCRDRNIDLITLYENEWTSIDDRKNIKDRILTYFGKFDSIDIDSCQIDDLDSDDFINFLIDNSYYNQIEFDKYYSIVKDNILAGVIGQVNNCIEVFTKNSIVILDYSKFKKFINCDYLIINNRWPLVTIEKSMSYVGLYKNQLPWKFGKLLEKSDNDLSNCIGIVHDCGYSKYLIQRKELDPSMTQFLQSHNLELLDYCGDECPVYVKCLKCNHSFEAPSYLKLKSSLDDGEEVCQNCYLNH